MKLVSDLALDIFADVISPLYKRLVPHAYNNMVAYEDVAGACRVGKNPGKPFSGITTVMDFCAHSHRDRHNMEAGLTGMDTKQQIIYLFIFLLGQFTLPFVPATLSIRSPSNKGRFCRLRATSVTLTSPHKLRRKLGSSVVK